LDAIAATLLDPEFGEAHVDAAIEALAMAGILVQRDPNDLLGYRPVEGKASPLRFLRWQVQNMALELSAGAGQRGDELDALIDTQPGAPPPSYLLAGYVAAAETTGGELARRLMGGRDWARAPLQTFPSLVMALCASDLALDTPAEATVRPLAYVPAPVSGALAIPAVDACGLVGGYVEQVVNSLFNALKVAVPQSGIGKVLAQIWNFLVDLAQTGVELALELLTDAVLGIVKAIAALVGIGSLVLSALKVWTISLQADPGDTRFGVGGEIIQGEMRVRVTNGGLGEWPAEIVSCAALGGVALPDLTPSGAKLSWKLTEAPIDLVQIASDPGLLDDDGRATLVYLTNNEPEEQAKGEPREGLLTVKATVDRPDLEQLKNAIADLSFSALPGIVQTVLVPILGNKAKSIASGLVSLAAMNATRTIPVIYHELQPTPTPEPTVTEEPGTGTSCPFGDWSVVNFAEYAEGVARAAGADVTYQAAGGSSTFSVSEKEFTWVFDAVSVVGTMAIEGMGVLNVLVTIDGQVSGDVVQEENTLILTKQSRSFSMVMAATLDGVDMGSQKVSPALFGVSTGATLIYTCTATGMEVSQAGVASTSVMILEPA
jgi:hypothetical protein